MCLSSISSNICICKNNKIGWDKETLSPNAIISTKIFQNDENIIGLYVQKNKIHEKNKIYNILNI